MTYVNCYRFVGIIVPTTTHTLMFGGLFSSQPVPPLAADPAWAHRSSPSELAAWVTEQALKIGANEDSIECGVECATMYAAQTIDAITVDSDPVCGSGTPVVR